jgi:hypothetical protein
MVSMACAAGCNHCLRRWSALLVRGLHENKWVQGLRHCLPEAAFSLYKKTAGPWIKSGATDPGMITSRCRSG